jgi:hypothetical protein
MLMQIAKFCTANGTPRDRCMPVWALAPGSGNDGEDEAGLLVRAPVQGAAAFQDSDLHFLVAGAGFEPATSGL